MSTLLYAVFGDPITHSLSPKLHHSFAESCGIQLEFRKIQCPAGGLSKALAQFQAEGGIGACLTAPLKVEGFGLCSQHTEAAYSIQCVNTVKHESGHWLGHSTDSQAFFRDCERLGINWSRSRVALLGAGGAAQSIFPSLVAKNPKALVIYNRTHANAAGMIKNADAQFSGMDEEQEPFDVVIHASSLRRGLYPIPAALVKGAFVYDLNYTATGVTMFTEWALENGAARAVDGWGMLVYQGAEAFAWWHGVMPDVERLVNSPAFLELDTYL
ncbi:MAG: shikimate dehydrogenase [Pseudomonadota bacterium]